MENSKAYKNKMEINNIKICHQYQQKQSLFN
jgi:hypothetical protein